MRLLLGKKRQMAKKKYTIELDTYSVRWIDEVVDKRERNLPVDDGTLLTIADLFLEAWG